MILLCTDPGQHLSQAFAGMPASLFSMRSLESFGRCTSYECHTYGVGSRQALSPYSLKWWLASLKRFVPARKSTTAQAQRRLVDLELPRRHASWLRLDCTRARSCRLRERVHRLCTRYPLGERRRGLAAARRDQSSHLKRDDSRQCPVSSAKQVRLHS